MSTIYNFSLHRSGDGQYFPIGIGSLETGTQLVADLEARHLKWEQDGFPPDAAEIVRAFEGCDIYALPTDGQGPTFYLVDDWETDDNFDTMDYGEHKVVLMEGSEAEDGAKFHIFDGDEVSAIAWAFQAGDSWTLVVKAGEELDCNYMGIYTQLTWETVLEELETDWR